MSTPVVLCGISKVMGGRVAPRLQPDFEVIHFLTSAAQAAADIPVLVAGGHPPRDPDDVGTHDFSRPPRAVIFGRGFEPAQVEEIRLLCGGDRSGLVWLQGRAEDRARVRAQPPDPDDPAALDGYAERTSMAIGRVLREVLGPAAAVDEGAVFYY